VSIIADNAILIDFLEKKTIIRFAYLFGSCATGKQGPLSDLDIAVFLDDKMDFFSCRLILMEELSCELHGERSIDLVVLNEASTVLRYEIIRDGIVLKEGKERRVEFETHVLREYLDTEPLRAVHRAALKRSFRKEHHFGE
jgi:uncharacterized protein